MVSLSIHQIVFFKPRWNQTLCKLTVSTCFAPPFFTVADRGVEDEGAGEEAAGASGEAGRGSRQGEARLAEKNSESRTRSLGVPEPDRCGLRRLGVGGELRNIPTIYAIRSSKIIILNRLQKLLRKEVYCVRDLLPKQSWKCANIFLSEKQQNSQMKGNLFQIIFYLFLLRIFFLMRRNWTD